jgi:formyl-CoA transferase
LTGISTLVGILTALAARDRGALNQRLEVAVQEVVAFTEWKGPAYFAVDNRLRGRGGSGSYWMVVRASDGFIGLVYHDAEWPYVKELIGDPALDDERFANRAGRVEHREELRELIERSTVHRKKLDLYLEGQALGVPLGVVADMADLEDSPQYVFRKFLETVDHPATGPVAYPGTPVQFNHERPPTKRAPLLGEHNDEMYRSSLGMSEEEIAELTERRVI